MRSPNAAMRLKRIFCRRSSCSLSYSGLLCRRAVGPRGLGGSKINSTKIEMGDEARASRDKANEIAAIRVSLILALDQREGELMLRRMDIVAKRDAEIARMKERLKELGADE
jgi:hypothetical protein